MRNELKEAIRRIHSDDYNRMVATTKKVKRAERFSFFKRFLNGHNGARKPTPRSRGRKVVLLTALFAILVIFGAGVYYFNRYSHVTVDLGVRKSVVDIEIQRRSSLIPRLLTISTEYALHERALYKYVSEMRKQLAAPTAALASVDPKSIEKLLSSLVAVAEQYPDLKATQSFEQLMKDWTETENRIAEARSRYMDSLKEYNTLCTTFPSNAFGFLFGWGKSEYYSFKDASWPEFDLSRFYLSHFEQNPDDVPSSGFGLAGDEDALSASLLTPNGIQPVEEKPKEEVPEASSVGGIQQPEGQVDGN